jgi:ribosomal protein S18 acetylase RimI-like enzyme
VRSLQQEAAAAGKPLRLHVLNSNVAAVRFYERLAFKALEDDGSYLSMEWQPTTPGDNHA